MGVIGGGVFQAIKGFRNAPVVSPSLPWVLLRSCPDHMGYCSETAWNCQSRALIHSGVCLPTVWQA